MVRIIDDIVWIAIGFAIGWYSYMYVHEHYLCILGNCFIH